MKSLPGFKLDFPELQNLSPEKCDEINLLLKTQLGETPIGKFAFRLGAIFCMVMMAVLVFVYDASIWIGMPLGLTAMAIGFVIGYMYEIKRLKKKVTSVVQNFLDQQQR
ncbi:MAG: hypothetical protein CMJ19_08385 [Phycisphaeraceae bacterium]|nr:hypothetical protein [Phycisphaeraceae bacterium]